MGNTKDMFLLMIGCGGAVRPRPGHVEFEIDRPAFSLD